MPRLSEASCTSAQRSAAASDLRNPPWNNRLIIALSTAPRSAAVVSLSTPRPVRRGILAVARMAAQSSAVRPAPGRARVRLPDG